VPGAAPGGVAPWLDAAAWLAAIVESSDDAMTGKTLDGVITSWNSAAERLYGYRAAEILGRNVSVLIPPDRPAELGPILERVANGGHVEKYETQRLRKDGTIVDVSITISPIRDATNTIVGASTVARDISDRNRAATELLALQDRLNQAQRLESLGQLAGGIAHDFNNLLAGMMNYAALASDGLEKLTMRLGLGEDEEAATLCQDLAEITVVATRAAQLTRQLLIFSRREVPRAEVIDLNAIVTDMEKLLGQALGEAIELVTDLAPDLPRTNVDRGQIEQVLMNLVVNARDAMPRGGRLRIETAGCEAEGDWARQQGDRAASCVCLMVSDTGCGMAPDVRARAFDPFFTTKAKGEGSGLGLATVYGIVTQAGGGVVVRSEPGLGTTIRVELPTTEAVAGPAQEVLPGKPTTSLGETILLVEDEDIVREPTMRILARNGYTVLSASNAGEALKVAHEHTGTISLLLTDVVMPGRSGKDLAAELSRLRPGTRVLYMSGYNQEVVIHEDATDGGLNLIEKPFIAVDLLRAIRQVLDSG
jgi:two-component system cell cycle sensor histidine kinase/response regulator CckA